MHKLEKNVTQENKKEEIIKIFPPKLGFELDK
jgi:hypothetical protein